MKKMLLLIFLFSFTLITFSQQDIFWRNGANTNNWWDSNNPWYRTCDGWWLNRPDYNTCNNSSTIGGNYIHFDNNNNPLMTVNGAYFKAYTLTFESTASDPRTLNADASGGLSFTSSSSYITNKSAVTHSFNCSIGVDNSTLTINAFSGPFLFNNPIYINGNALIFTGSFNNNVSGVIYGTGNLTKEGSGFLTLTGANTYTGITTITSGELRLNPAANSTPASQFVLNGGTLSTTGITASRTITSSSTLQLNNSSTIALGSNAHTLTFAASNGLTWVAGKTITITGWTGSGGVTGTAGKIFVGNSAAGLTAGQLAQISFTGYTGTAAILSSGEVVPSITFSAGALISFANVCINTTTSANLFTITGANLSTANVTVGALPGFTYSTTSGGSYTTSLSLTQPGGSYSQAIYVKFSPTAVQSYNGNIAVGGGGATSVNVAAAGSGINTPPTVTTPSSASVATTSATLGGNMTVVGCNNATEQGIYYSITAGFADGAGTKVSTTGLNVSSTGTFTQAVTGLTSGTVYYFKAFATSSSGAAYSSQGTFTTLNDVATAGYRSYATGNWNTAGTWEYNSTGSTWATATQVPGSGNSVTIKAAHAVEVDADAATCAGLTIESTASLTINAGKSLTVTGTLINNATSSGLVIKSDATGTGSLIEHSGVAATVQRYIMNDFKWHFLSSPVSSQAIWSAFAPTPTGTPLIFAGGPTYGWDFYYYNPNVPSSGLYWVNLRKTGGAYNNGTVDAASDAAGFGTTTPPTFTVGKGYLVAYNTTPFTATHTFSGTLNMGPVSKTIVSSPNAYNLVGNPYPSSIDWKSASWGTGRDALFNNSGYDYWIWNENPTVGNYAVFNSSGSGSVNGASQYIAPSQAFFVKAASGGTFGMNDAIRVHSNQPFLKNANSETNFVRLKIENTANTYSDEMIVEFNPDFTGGGSEKFWSFYAESPELYSVKDGNNYSIDRYTELLADMKVNIAAKTGVAATYTITAGNISDFTLSDRVYLLDKKTGVKTNLKQTPSYSFAGTPDDDRNRFQLIFGAPIGTDETMAAAFAVFSSENSIFVRHNNAHTAYSVLVTNMLGQIITRVKLTGNDLKRIDEKFVPGVYIVTLYSGGNMFSEKVVVM